MGLVALDFKGLYGWIGQIYQFTDRFWTKCAVVYAVEYALIPSAINSNINIRID